MERKKKISRRQIKSFYRMPFKLKIVVIEAFLLMAISRFSILFIPFRRVAAFMGKPMRETADLVESELMIVAKQIAWLIEKISRYTPWESKCLVKALTGQIMLKKRKISCTLYLGIKKNKANALSAHAWLRCGNVIILGENGRLGYTTVAYFGTD